MSVADLGTLPLGMLVLLPVLSLLLVWVLLVVDRSCRVPLAWGAGFVGLPFAFAAARRSRRFLGPELSSVSDIVVLWFGKTG